MRRLIFLLFGVLVSCMLFAETESVQKYVVNVEDFDKLKVSDGLKVVYRCNADSAGLAVFDATQAEAQSLIFTNKKSTLVLQVVTEYAIADSILPVITVYSSTIRAFENNSDSTLLVENVSTDGELKFRMMGNGKIVATDIEAQKVKAKIFTGRGEIILSGKCDKAEFSSTGKGFIYAQDLVATDVDCRIVGTGWIYCNVNGGSLSTRGSGPGRVLFDGQPAEINSRHFGKLKVVSFDGQVLIRDEE